MTRYQEGCEAAILQAVKFEDRILETAKAIGSFLDDPPDTEYQRGYLAALKMVMLHELRHEQQLHELRREQQQKTILTGTKQ